MAQIVIFVLQQLHRRLLCRRAARARAAPTQVASSRGLHLQARQVAAGGGVRVLRGAVVARARHVFKGGVA